MIKRNRKNILVIELNWLGDVLFSTPFIYAIRRRFKDSYIACLVDPGAGEILEGNPDINEIITYDEKGIHRGLIGKIKLIMLLRKKHFDLAFILHRSFTKALIAFLSRIKERVGYTTKNRGFLLTHPVEIPEEALHKVEYFLKIADSMNCDISSKNYKFVTGSRDKKYIEDILRKDGVREGDFLVVVNPGGNWLPKQWSEDNFAKVSDELIEKYNVKLVISGAQKDIKKALRIKDKMKNEPIILAGKTSLKELGALLERSDLVISGDSGPMHIAIAKGKKVIALFGPTSPFLTGPYGEGTYRVIQKDIGCEVPCYDLTCSDYKCMNAITPKDVLEIFSHMCKNA